MGALDQVIQLKNQGLSEPEIANQLRQQGFSPKDISDALGQAQIKTAITGEINMADYDTQNPEEEMQLSVMEQEQYPGENYGEGNYKPQTQEAQGYNENYAPQPAQGYSPDQYQQYQQDYYQPQASFTSSGGFDTDTAIEIAEQIFFEKTADLKKQIEELNELKVLTKTRIENISSRLDKIESIIDKLQIAILEKIGSYGENLSEIKKEMSMMQESFGKIVNPIADRAEHHRTTHIPTKKSKK